MHMLSPRRLKHLHIPHPRVHKKRRYERGAAPGTIIPDPESPPPRITILAYSPANYIEQQITEVAQLGPILKEWPCVWVNVEGLGDSEVLHALRDFFEIHRLALEDVVNTHQRAKCEEYDNQLYMVARMVNETRPVVTEQLSLFLGDNYVVTFQEIPGDCLDPVRRRIRQDRGRVRREGPDYLAYCLVDAVLDDYFPHLDVLGEALEELEDEVIYDPSPEVLDGIQQVKRDLLSLRQAVAPLRDALNTLMRDVAGRIGDTARLHFRDAYDHTTQVMDLVEMQREIAMGLLDIYLNSSSNRLNEVMKVLTVIATIFIPLTFLVGVYGMNFDHSVSKWNMPELYYPYGYPIVWGVILAILIAELVIFWRMGWLGSGQRKRKR